MKHSFRKRFTWIFTLAIAALVVIPLATFARVWTDQQDYSPGDIVTIHGDNSDNAGYLPGETVHVSVTGPNGYSADCEATADASGAWSCQLTLWPDNMAVGTYYYTATGQTSNVSQSGTFTDGNATVTGTVKDSNGNPISGATVACTTSSGCNANLSTTTDGSGNYFFDGVSGHGPKLTFAGGGSTTLTLTASKTGYTSGSLTLPVENGQTYNNRNFILTLACTAPSTTNPASATQTVGDSVTFSVTASGTAPLSYQWRKGGVPIGGATGSSYTIASVVTADAGSYDVVVSNSCGSATSGAATLTVNKANATIVVTPYSVTYDGAAHTATGSATGVNSEDLSGLLDLSGTTHTNAGSYNGDAWSFAGNDNYKATDGTVNDSIAKADATCEVTGYDVTYDGNAHTATGSCTGVGGDGTLSGLDLSGTAHTNAGSYTDSWSFTDVTGNYNNDSSTVTDSIAKANASITVTPYSVTYDGAAHTATGSATGVLGESLSGLDFSGTTHTNAGSYTDSWSFTDVTGNYNNDSSTVTDSIAKANASITVTPYSVTYDGAAHTATGSATGVLGESLSGLDLSGATHTDPGDYLADSWSFAGNSNYNTASGTVHDNIHYATSGICNGGPGHSILQPINADGTSVWKKGSTVPAKFRVCDANGNSIGTAGVVTSFKLIQRISGTATDVDEAVDSTTPDTAFRWDPTGKQWIYNINTKSLTAGYTYVYRITLNDGSNIDFKFGLK